MANVVIAGTRYDTITVPDSESFRHRRTRFSPRHWFRCRIFAPCFRKWSLRVFATSSASELSDGGT